MAEQRLIDAYKLMQAMYDRAFETDGDTMWQSGCWVRYRAVEQVIRAQPTIEERKTGKWCGLWSEPQDDKSIYGKKLIEGDTVYLLGVEGTVRQENGAWGWGSCNYVPWELLENKMPHNNKPSFCYCDNFISFWELKWNFDDGNDWDGVPYIRHNCGAKMEKQL